MPRVRATPPPPPSRRSAGDVICGKCGQGNDASRRFCQRCGTSLAQAAPAPVALSWWKRWFGRTPKTYKAGERRTRGRGARSDGRSGTTVALKKAFRVVLAVGSFVLFIALIGPWRPSLMRRARSASTDVRQMFVPTYVALHPDGAEASTALADHPAGNAIDGATNTAWQEADAGDGENQKLVLTFRTQVDIDRIGIHSGVSDKPDEYLAQPRPRELHVAFSDGASAVLRLKDTPDFQTFKVKARAVVRIEITIAAVNPSFKGGHDAGIAEVEVFTRR